MHGPPTPRLHTGAQPGPGLRRQGGRGGAVPAPHRRRHLRRHLPAGAQASRCRAGLCSGYVGACLMMGARVALRMPHAAMCWCPPTCRLPGPAVCCCRARSLCGPTCCLAQPARSRVSWMRLHALCMRCARAVHARMRAARGWGGGGGGGGVSPPPGQEQRMLAQPPHVHKWASEAAQAAIDAAGTRCDGGALMIPAAADAACSLAPHADGGKSMTVCAAKTPASSTPPTPSPKPAAPASSGVCPAGSVAFTWCARMQLGRRRRRRRLHSCTCLHSCARAACPPAARGRPGCLRACGACKGACRLLPPDVMRRRPRSQPGPRLRRQAGRLCHLRGGSIRRAVRPGARTRAITSGGAGTCSWTCTQHVCTRSCIV